LASPARRLVLAHKGDELGKRTARSSCASSARYDAVRAERAFHACDPENRLVARSLEDRWEQKLRELQDAEAELAEHAVAAPDPSREQIEALARDLPALWAAHTTSDRDRKRLLRSLIADVTLTSDPHEPIVHVGIRWQSGAAEQHAITRPQGIIRRTPPQALDLLTRLAPHRSNAEIAAELNARGLRTATGRPFDARAISQLRSDHRLARQSLLRDDELTVTQVAERLGVCDHTVYYWINHDHLAARRTDGNRVCIPFPPQVEEHWRQHVAESGHIPAKAKITSTGGAV
jgi:excisionase family DNA binding protein